MGPAGYGRKGRICKTHVSLQYDRSRALWRLSNGSDNRSVAKDVHVKRLDMSLYLICTLYGCRPTTGDVRQKRNGECPPKKGDNRKCRLVHGKMLTGLGS